MITDETLGHAPWRYMNDVGWFSGYVMDYREIDGTAEVIITAGGEQGDRSELTRRPIAEGEDYRDIIRAYADQVEAETYEREGWPGE